LADPQIPGYLRDRLAGVPDPPDRSLFEVLIELPACSRHRPGCRADFGRIGRTHKRLPRNKLLSLNGSLRHVRVSSAPASRIMKPTLILNNQTSIHNPSQTTQT